MVIERSAGWRQWMREGEQMIKSCSHCNGKGNFMQMAGCSECGCTGYDIMDLQSIAEDADERIESALAGESAALEEAAQLQDQLQLLRRDMRDLRDVAEMANRLGRCEDCGRIKAVGYICFRCSR